MNVKEAIQKRRAYRSLDPVEIGDDLIRDLAECAQLFCSCNNNQPWQYVFVRGANTLKKMHGALSPGNEWARAASMIIAVFSKPEHDCMIKGRNYYLFDTGMATAAIILHATEQGLVAHPIAGYSPRKAREILGIPDDMEIIALVIVGKHSDTVSPVLSDKQVQAEKKRPERKPLQSFVHIDTYKGKM